MIPDRAEDVQPPPPRVAAVILAAGISQRFGLENKLLARVDGEALVRRVARAYLGAGLSPAVLVVGYESGNVIETTAGLGLYVVDNPSFETGMSSSIVCGIRALPDDVEAVVVGVADQPHLTAGVVSSIVDRFRSTAARVVRARYSGQPAPPVLFHRPLFPELLALRGDEGARYVAESVGDRAQWVDFQEADLGRDIDTPADLIEFSSAK